MNEVLIVGCGYVGTRLARHLLKRGDKVRALVRTSSSEQALRHAGISAQALDITCDPLPKVNGQAVIYLIAPPAHGQTDEYLRRWLNHTGTPAHFTLISTTGVYGDCNGAWITEAQALNPQVDRARRRVDAQRQAQAWSAAYNIPLAIVRLPGIYGPGRLPRQRLVDRQPVLTQAQSPYSNRIHVDDVVTACTAIIDQNFSGEIHISDGNPSTMTDYFNQVATALGLPLPPQISLAQAQQTFSGEMLSYLAESKRLDISRMRNDLGVIPRYPDLACGLAHSLGESDR